MKKIHKNEGIAPFKQHTSLCVLNSLHANHDFCLSFSVIFIRTLDRGFMRWDFSLSVAMAKFWSQIDQIEVIFNHMEFVGPVKSRTEILRKWMWMSMFTQVYDYLSRLPWQQTAMRARRVMMDKKLDTSIFEVFVHISTCQARTHVRWC